MFDFAVLEQFDHGLAVLQGGLVEEPVEEQADAEFPDQAQDAVCPFAHGDA